MTNKIKHLLKYVKYIHYKLTFDLKDGSAYDPKVHKVTYGQYTLDMEGAKKKEIFSS